MWESVPFHFKSGPISKSFPIPFRCVAVSYCHFHLSSELTELTTLTIHPTAFCLLGWNALSSNSQSESAVTIALLLPSSRSQHWAADAVAYSTAAPWNTVFFFLHPGSFLCSHALFCLAYHLSPFLSKDIHQRNMAPPSPVTPTALCQLFEAESKDCCCCCCCWCWRGGYRQHTRSSTAHICLYQNSLLPEWLPEQ